MELIILGIFIFLSVLLLVFKESIKQITKNYINDKKILKEKKMKLKSKIRKKINEIEVLKREVENNTLLEYKTWSFEIYFGGNKSKLDDFLNDIKNSIYEIEKMKNEKYDEIIFFIDDIKLKFNEFKNTLGDYETVHKYGEYKNKIIENENKILEFLQSF